LRFLQVADPDTQRLRSSDVSKCAQQAIEANRAPDNTGEADVRIGVISRASGKPDSEPQWQWHCGFDPGSHPGEYPDGSTDTFDQARIEFGAAWGPFLLKRTEEDFETWRYDRHFAAWKRAM
jgi:hypothetical protein